MAFGLAIDLFPLESIDALAAKLGINPLPSGSDPYTEIHRPRWRPFWKAYFMTSLLKYFSNTMFPGITTAPRQSQGKQILASFLIGDTADSLSLSGAAECFACSKAATAVEYVSLDGGDSIAIGDSDASNPTRRRALKIRPSRAIGDVFKPDSQWGNPTLFIVPPHAEVPTNLDSVLASLEQSNATITLCGMNVIEAGRKAIGGLFPPSTAGGSGFRRAGKWILVDGGSLSGTSLSQLRMRRN